MVRQWLKIVEDRSALLNRGRAKDESVYCIFTALIRKCPEINVAGEWNRTLVIIQRRNSFARPSAYVL